MALGLRRSPQRVAICVKAGDGAWYELAGSSDGNLNGGALGPSGAVTIADGADATLGATADSASTNTVFGWLKKLVSLLPAALGGHGGLVVEGVASGTPIPVSVASLPLDTVNAALATDKIYNGATALTPKFAVITASTSGVNQIVAAVNGKQIRVLSYTLSVSAAVNSKWQSHVSPTDETGLIYAAAAGTTHAGFSPVGHFQTIAGEALDLNLSGNVAVGGSLVYVEV